MFFGSGVGVEKKKEKKRKGEEKKRESFFFFVSFFFFASSSCRLEEQKKKKKKNPNSLFLRSCFFSQPLTSSLSCFAISHTMALRLGVNVRELEGGVRVHRVRREKRLEGKEH